MAQGTDVEVACLTHIVDMLVEGQLTVECDPEALHGPGRLNSDPGDADGGYVVDWFSSATGFELDRVGFGGVEYQSVVKQPLVDAGDAPF